MALSFLRMAKTYSTLILVYIDYSSFDWPFTKQLIQRNLYVADLLRNFNFLMVDLKNQRSVDRKSNITSNDTIINGHLIRANHRLMIDGSLLILPCLLS